MVVVFWGGWMGQRFSVVAVAAVVVVVVVVIVVVVVVVARQGCGVSM